MPKFYAVRPRTVEQDPALRAAVDGPQPDAVGPGREESVEQTSIAKDPSPALQRRRRAGKRKRDRPESCALGLIILA
jgi:hypothetical protein